MKNTYYFLILICCVFLFVQSSSNPMIAQKANKTDTSKTPIIFPKKSNSKLSKALLIDSIITLSNKIDSSSKETEKCLSLLRAKEAKLRKESKVIDSLLVTTKQKQ